MNITTTTKLFDLLAGYPDLEEKIIGIAPPFKNLKNPVLRKTVTKLVTIEKVALIGNQDVNGFLNTLRREVGQEETGGESKMEISWNQGEPEWIKEKPAEIVNGTEMLGRGVHPLAHINEIMKSLDKKQFVRLLTNFKPIPLIEAMETQNFEVFSKTDSKNSDEYFTFIRKN